MLNPAILAAAAAVGLSTATAMAATVPTTFDLSGVGGSKDSHSFRVDGLDLTVTAHKHTGGVLGEQIKVGQWGTGLGASHGHDSSHLVDGFGTQEMVIFSFSERVQVHAVAVSYFDPWDDIEIASYAEAPFSGGLLLGSSASDVALVEDSCHFRCNGRSNDHGITAVGKIPAMSSRVFGVGADGWFDDFKISGLTVTPQIATMPLPAGAWMLLAALAVLLVLRWRKAA